MTDTGPENPENAPSRAARFLPLIADGVVHECNNVMTIVLGSLDVALASPSLDASLRTVLQTAREACFRGAEISRSLLRLIKVQPPQLELREVDAHLNVVAPLLRHLVGPEQRIDFRLAAGGALARFDPAWLDIAMINLVANARNAISATGSVRIESAFIDDEERSGSAPCVEVTVVDEGTGIPPEVLRRVFEPGFTTRRETGGFGLGLPMARQLLRALGGEVELDSELGKGTRAVLRLPVAWCAAPEPPRPEAGVRMRSGETIAPRETGAAQRVLVVEDDAGLRELAELVLSGEGYAVSTASDAGEALSLLEQGTFDLVFSDVRMPGGMDGTELAGRIAERWPQTRILMASGFFDGAKDATHRWALLPKPYEPAALLREVARILEARNACGNPS